MNDRKQKKSPSLSDEERSAESRRILERIERDSETVATSSMARATDMLSRTLGETGEAANQEDAIERLGRRIGRSLGWLAVIGLVVYLVATYIL